MEMTGPAKIQLRKKAKRGGQPEQIVSCEPQWLLGDARKTRRSIGEEPIILHPKWRNPSVIRPLRVANTKGSKSLSYFAGIAQKAEDRNWSDLFPAEGTGYKNLPYFFFSLAMLAPLFSLFPSPLFCAPLIFTCYIIRSRLLAEAPSTTPLSISFSFRIRTKFSVRWLPPRSLA